jgi:NAD(P)-dependent dehydrogenase (short-subunit alcohol dehydrogenase family)
MRCRPSAQSAASAPPAWALIVISASRESYSPASSVLISSWSISPRRAVSSAAASCRVGSSFSLSAYQRSDPITYGIDEVQRATGCSNSLRDKVVLISGATRGFGNVLTKMFALHGATVFANCRASRNEIDATASEVRRWNNKVFAVPGDVSKIEDCRRIRAEIDDRVGQIDILVSNAFPQIPAAGFMEQSSSEFLRFVNESVSTTVTLLRELLPLVSDGGIVVLVSTRYTCEPQAQYSHYIASKYCLEGLMRVLALEFPRQKFVVIRPPRMLTDQTNLPFDLSPPVSAITAAQELMESIGALNGCSNLIEIDLGKND